MSEKLIKPRSEIIIEIKSHQLSSQISMSQTILVNKTMLLFATLSFLPTGGSHGEAPVKFRFFCHIK